MLTRNDIFNRIDRIIDLSYLTFAYDLLGDEFMSDEQKRTLEGLGYIIGKKSLVEVLYALVRYQPEGGYGNRKLQELIESWTTAGNLPVFTDTQQATLDNTKVAMNDALENSKADVKKQIRQKILDVNKQFKHDQAVKRYSNIPEEQRKTTDYAALLIENLGLIGALVQKNFMRGFTSAMTDAVNDAVVDNVTEGAMFSGLDPSKTQVFKKVTNDGSLCQWCAKFYGVGTAKLYTLAELQANGSNYGKPKSEWKPVIGSTHPSCRCELHIVKPV